MGGEVKWRSYQNLCAIPVD